MRKSKRNGFTMLEALLGMLAALVCTILATVFLHTCLRLLEVNTDHQDQMAILQIRQLLALSDSIDVGPDQIHMIYQHQSVTIEQDKDRLVRRDGYEILMEQIDHVSFTVTDDEINMAWTKENRRYNVQLY